MEAVRALVQVLARAPALAPARLHHQVPILVVRAPVQDQKRVHTLGHMLGRDQVEIKEADRPKAVGNKAQVTGLDRDVVKGPVRDPDLEKVKVVGQDQGMVADMANEQLIGLSILGNQE